MPNNEIVEQNPDVRPTSILERSGSRVALILFGGMLVEAAVKYLTGVEAWWAPPLAAGLAAAWAAFRGPPSYRQDKNAPDVVVRP
jgi:hypothetical protein